MLTPAQQKEVRLTLLNSDIRYYEVYEELADHYLSAVEERLQAGCSFEDALASTHESFGKRGGLKKLEKSYRKNAIQHYRRLHWQEFRERFRWPHILIILLAGMVSYQLTDVVHAKYLIGGILLLSLLPFVLTAFAGGSTINDQLWGNRVFLPKTLRREALSLQSNTSISIFNLLFFGSKILLSNEQWRTFIEHIHPVLFTLLLVFSFVWAWSFYLTVRNTKPRFT